AASAALWACAAPAPPPSRAASTTTNAPTRTAIPTSGASLGQPMPRSPWSTADYININPSRRLRKGLWRRTSTSIRACPTGGGGLAREGRPEETRPMIPNDFPSLNFDLGETADQLRASVRGFTADEIAPLAAEIDKSNEFPRGLWPKLGAMGLLGI